MTQDSITPITLAFVTHSLVRGGSPIFLLEFLKVLDRTSFRPILISEQDGPLRTAFQDIQVPVRILPRRGPLELGLLRDLIRTLRQEHARLVHLNTFSNYYKYGALAGRWLGLPVVWGIREDARARRCRKLEPWIKSLATSIVPCSHEIASVLYPSPSTPPRKLRVIHDGITPRPTPPPAPTRLREELNLPPTTPLIGCVAALEPRKGIHDLIEAFAITTQQPSTHTHLVCVGEDRSPGHAYRPTLEKRLAELGLSNRVHFTGSRSDVDALHPQFNLFVLPTYWEGIARVLLEAVNANCPIVTTRAGGNPELIEDGRSGWLVPPGNPAALAAAIEYALSRSPDQTRAITATARQTLLQQFTLETHTHRMSELYRELLAPSPLHRQ